MKKAVVIVVCGVLALTSLIFADVKNVSTTTMNFEGTTGTVMKFFGAGKPVKSVDYYKDNVMRSDSFNKKGKPESSQIIDLDKELFITLNHKDKEYTQMTFDEWRQLMQDTIDSLGKEQYGDVEESKEEPSADVEWDLKVDVKETGEKEKIAGKNTEKIILTLDLDAEATSTESEDDQAPESVKGGLIVTSNHWVYKGDDAAKKEIEEFGKGMAEKFGFVPGQTGAKEIMGKVMAQNSQLGDAIKEMQKEGKKLQGISMRVETKYESKLDPETVKKLEEEKASQKKEDKNTEIPTSVGGLLGGFGKKMMKKHIEKDDEGIKERNTLMTSTVEVLEFDTTSLSGSLFEVPAKYKFVEQKTEE